MKNFKTNILFILISFISFQVTGQKTLTEGYIQMEISKVSSDDEQMAMALEMMKGSKTDIYFEDGKNLSKMNMMGGMVQLSTLFDDKDGSVNMLFDMMGQKMHVVSSKDEMESATADQKASMDKLKVMNHENDTKEILGYNCTKTTIVDEKGTALFEMYLSKEVKADSRLLQGLQYFDLQGFPLEFTTTNPEMSMTMTVTKLDAMVDAAVFDLNTEGYQKLDFKDFMEKMGGMGSGFGF